MRDLLELSPLMAGAGTRLLGAGGAVLALWLAVWWALGVGA